MNVDEIKGLIVRELGSATVEIQGEGGKFLVSVVSDYFEGLSAVKRQQSIYKILNSHIQSGEIHAVSMDLATPNETG